MPSQKKLAAIMFTDIVGYTRLMGQDENRAMDLVRKNRDIHKRIAKQYNGKLLKEIGDGNLLSFDSTSDAVSCGGAIIDAAEKIEGLDLRVGIHQGEIIVENDDIYGDGVNIASRIENQAKANTVLVSDTVNRNIRNKGFTTQFVEEVELKNVDEPVKVYQVTGYPESEKQNNTTSNLVKYLVAGVLAVGVIATVAFFSLSNNAGTKDSVEIGEDLSEGERFAVLPFDNRTSNQDLSSLGKMISDWTTELVFEAGRQIVSPKTVEQNVEFAGIIPANPSGKVSFNEMTGATKIIEGEYYIVQKKLRVTARLIDALNGDVLYQFEEIKGSQENAEVIVQEISQVIAGYLATERSVNLGFFAPPKYEAYKVYKDALKSTSQQRFIEGIRKALQIDSSFSAPYRDFYFTFDGDAEKAFQTLKRHKTQLTRYETLMMQVSREANWEQGLAILSEIHDMDPYDIENRSRYIARLVIGGHPRTALDIMEKNPIQLSEIDTSNFYDVQYFENYLDAQVQMGNYEKALDAIYQLPFNKRSLELIQFASRVLVRLDRSNEVEVLLDSVSELRPADFNDGLKATMYQATGLELQLVGKNDSAYSYLAKALEYDSELTPGAVAYTKLLMGLHSEAEMIYEGILANDSLMLSQANPPIFDPNVFYLGRLGVVKALLGKKEEAKEIIAKLLSEKITKASTRADKTRISFFNFYQSAQIHANLGEPKRAMDLLRSANQFGGVSYSGYGDVSTYLRWDPLLLVLKDYGPYVEFCRPKDLNLEIN